MRSPSFSPPSFHPFLDGWMDGMCTQHTRLHPALLGHVSRLDSAHTSLFRICIPFIIFIFVLKIFFFSFHLTGLLPARCGVAMPWKALRCSCSIQLGPCTGPQEPPTTQRPCRSSDEIPAAFNSRTHLQAVTGNATRQITFCRHLGSRTGATGCCSLQGGRRCPWSRSSHWYLFAQITRFRLLSPVLCLLGPLHARSGQFIPFYSIKFKTVT